MLGVGLVLLIIVNAFASPSAVRSYLKDDDQFANVAK